MAQKYTVVTPSSGGDWAQVHKLYCADTKKGNLASWEETRLPGMSDAAFAMQVIESIGDFEDASPEWVRFMPCC